ncbi:putative transcriptional regulator, TetR family [Frankia canadensis]|uniref:Putative transcriptional regulator, TetR family n=1 Tax=Frankia canadensis TaxID=1836972 RepID=A0A2I2KMZ0_9ACTN|nr:TetR family transcriptional regulator [Frankia canadensis]SNQ47012.1 putative transcriptional regulator, TetR family [Frankia canadensis]SOU54302.1 putative transcriptional regulator, TetR family [Frankia canadensis]
MIAVASDDPAAVADDAGPPEWRSVDIHELRRREVSRQIERAALELFSERGLAVSVDEIAAAAGISQRTFFRYFRGKDDVLLAYDRRVQDRLIVALAARPAAEGPVTALRNAFMVTCAVPPAGRRTVVRWSRVVASAPALQARLHGERAAHNAEIARLLADRMGVDPTTDPRPRVVTAAMVAVASAVWDEWTAAGGESDPTTAMSTALALVIAGFDSVDGARPRTLEDQ